MRTLKITSLCIASLSLVLSSRGIEILPNSYVLGSATDAGSYSYHDETGSQLIDGHYGVAPWFADLGHGNAYEWLGWLGDSPVNIDFDFGSARGINKIAIGTVQDSVGDVVIPNAGIYTSADNINWIFVANLLTPESSANDNTYKTLVFDNLTLNSQYIRVALSHSLDGPWTFTDEVDFYGEAHSVPDGGTSMLLLGTALASLSLIRRLKQ